MAHLGYSFLSGICPPRNRLILPFILFGAMAGTSLSATPPRGEAAARITSRTLRAMNAADQLRDYGRRIASGSATSRARDISGKSAEAGIGINSAALTTSTIFFFDDVESLTHTWTTELYGGATDDAWHRTTLNASSPSHSWWPGIEPKMTYQTGRRINTALKSESIDLTAAAGQVTLLFAENYVTESGWDYCMVDASSDGGTSWTPLRGGYGSAPSGDSHGWIISTLNLTPFAGHAIAIRFYFDTGDTNFNAFPGWFVDDVVIFDQGGQITGKKFFDVNNNGAKDAGERGVKDWVITAAGPVTFTTRTNVRGRYRFTLPLGSYTVTEQHQPNWTQKYPLSGQWHITLSTPDTIVDSIHFGNYTQASFISGVKFDDRNRDSVFDGGDTLIPDWKIVLEDTNGNQIDYDFTDSLGEYQLYVFQPGRYIVTEADRSGWIQTFPGSESYTIDIPDLNTDLNGRDFGNYHSDSANAIAGQKFEDLNRNGLKEDHEQGVGGFTIKLTGAKNRKTKTDSSGFYKFLSLPPGTYTVAEIPRVGWWQSHPPSSYTFHLASGELQDTADFGNYQISPGSIAGTKFNDVNGNGSRDSGEVGLSGWRINLTGTTYFGGSASQSLTTDQDGQYTFTGIWPGAYTVSEVWRSNWRQTHPPSLAPNFVSLGKEESRTGVDFGNAVDSSFSVAFRSFLPESLALSIDRKGRHKPIPALPDRVEFCLKFLNATGLPAAKVTAHFAIGLRPGSATFDRPGSLIPTGKPKRLEIGFDPAVSAGDSVTVHAFGVKPFLQNVTEWRWTFANDSAGAWQSEFDSCLNVIRYPMPNGLNAVQLVGAGLRVGLGGPHSVVHPNYTSVIKSLIERGDRMHIGEPRGLGKFSKGGSIKSQQKSLPPTKHNNKLFAEAIALQVNVLASDAGVTPGGFGNLVYDDGNGGGPAHPFNGLSIREVAAKLDSFMTGFNETTRTPRPPLSLSGLDSVAIWRVIRSIDSAFSGPLDTFGFSSGLTYKPVRGLSEVTYLRLDTSMARRSFVPVRPIVTVVPDQFLLYQNYPNPFNPTTVIPFELLQTSLVTITIYNVLGQEIARLLNREVMDEGAQEAEFDAARLPSGVYFYRLAAEGISDGEGAVPARNFVAVKKMLLVR